MKMNSDREFVASTAASVTRTKVTRPPPLPSATAESTSTSPEFLTPPHQDNLVPPTSPFLDTEDAVKVVVRIRPLNGREHAANSVSVVSAAGGSDGTVLLADPARPEPYAVVVDKVLDEGSTQENMYTAAGAAMVEHCMSGFNSSIFCYGQTGSGKTYTMLGDWARGADGTLSSACGLVPRVFEALFSAIAETEQLHRCGAGGSLRYSVKCSFLEIYNEEVTDLLTPNSIGLQIRDGDLARGVFVQGLSETEVLNADDVLSLISRGSENRRQAATAMNERSSRSHSVFTATIESHERTQSGILHVRFAKLNLIDLAGSERVGRTKATGDQLTEAKSINRSLAVLGRVIAALVERQRRPGVHVPYRDSRLTFLLQESLGGNSRTCIVANVTPASDSASETYSTLLFASGAKKIRCRAVVNEDRQGDAKALAAENARLEQLVAELQTQKAACSGESEIESLQLQLEQARSLFDQNNAAIQTMQVEQGLLRRQLNDAKAVAARIADEAAALRAENAVLTASLEATDVQREGLIQEAAKACKAVEAARQAAAVAVSDELSALRDELTAARAAVAMIVEEAADARAGRAAAEAMLEEVRAEVRLIQREAREESAAAAAREEGLKREIETLRERVTEAAAEAERLRKELSVELSSSRKFKRMVGDIGRLIDWAQSGVTPSIGGALSVAVNGGVLPLEDGQPSPAAQAALKVARLSLNNTAGQPMAAALEDATNNMRPGSAEEWSLPARKNNLHKATVAPNAEGMVAPRQTSVACRSS